VVKGGDGFGHLAWGCLGDDWMVGLFVVLWDYWGGAIAGNRMKQGMSSDGEDTEMRNKKKQISYDAN